MEIICDFNEEAKSGGGNTPKNNSPLNISTDEFGLSIIPVSSNKTPFQSWKQYQTTIAPISQWHSHHQKQGTVGIITGIVSGNLECIDVDVKNDPQKNIMTEYSKLIPDELLSRLLIQKTPNNGFHLIYRCPEVTIEGNQILAKDTSKEVIIETRGEGGYLCTSKVNNEILHGKLDLENLNIEIPTITKEERDILLETARSLNRFFPSANTSNSKNGKQFVYKESAINEFNNKYSILELFAKHNWKIVKEDEKKVYLKRDGSAATHSGYYFKESKTFFCFSTSTEFRTEKPYNHFQVLQVLEGNNDYGRTVRLLPSFGFEVEGRPNKISSDDIADYLNGIGIRYDSFIQDLTNKGVIIDERVYNTLFINMKKHFEKEISRQRFEEVIKSTYTQSVNPILEFIEKHIDRNPKGTFEKWLDCLVLKNKVVNKTILLEFLKKWYVGMIAQALDGEYPNEFFLTLISTDQGIGKTTMLRNFTLPKELQGYRKEHSLSFDDDFKVLMSQALLIIDDEMDGRTYEADKTFKTVLSTKELTTRRKYDRRISTIKRRCSFAGSGNYLMVVREQNNRRIIPIEIEKIHHDKLAELDLVDLFMEAYHLYKDGFQYSYQHIDKQLLLSLYDDYVQKSDVDFLLDEYIMKPEAIGDIFYISVKDIILGLAEKYPLFTKRLNVPNIGKKMSELGYKSVRKGKQRITCYEIHKVSKILQLLEDDAQSWWINKIEK